MAGYLDLLDPQGCRRQRRLPGAAGQPAAAGQQGGRQPRRLPPARGWLTGDGCPAAAGPGRGRVRHEQAGSPTPPGCSRTPPVCPPVRRGGRARRKLQPCSTRSYGAGALEAYAEKPRVDVAGCASGCALHLTMTATMNFEPNSRRTRRGLPALVDQALADGVDVTLRHLPVPGRLDHAERAAAARLAARRPGIIRSAATAPRTRRSGQRVGLILLLPPGRGDSTVATGCPSTGTTITVSGVTKAVMDPVVGRTVAEVARGLRAARRPGVLRRAAGRRPRGVHDPAARRRRGETGGRSWPTRGTAAVAT